jgi:hypothetical protein
MLRTSSGTLLVLVVQIGIAIDVGEILADARE